MTSPDHLPKVGVCAHPNVSADRTVAALAKIGVTRVRADCPWNASDGVLAWCMALAKAGATLCLSVNGWEGQGNADSALRYARQIATVYPDSVDVIEGPNEVNNDSQTWTGHSDPRGGDMGQRSAAHAVQSYLYQAVKADPVLSAVPVVSYTDSTAPFVVGAANFANMPPGREHRWPVGEGSGSAMGFSTMTRSGRRVDASVVTEAPFDPQARGRMP